MTILQEFHGALLVSVIFEDLDRSGSPCERVLWRRDEILSQVLAWSCASPYEKILWRSGWHPLRGPFMILHGSFWEDLVEILINSSLRGPCMILCRSLSEDLEMQILQMPCFRRAFQDLVRSSPAGPFVTILWASLQGPGMKILVKIFYTSLWEDLVEILLKFASRGPCTKILKMLCIGTCVQVLLGCS